MVISNFSPRRSAAAAPRSHITMSKQKNTGPSERELLLSRSKNLVIGSAISAAALLLGILVHIDFIAIPALLILAGSLSGLLSHLLQLRRLK